MKHYLIFLLASLFSASAITGHAALNDLGGGQIEDTTQNIVWLQDANVFKTLCDANDPIATGFTPVTATLAGNICHIDGRMEWDDAEAWIARLNSQNYLGSTDWRQPEVSQPDASCSLQLSAVGVIDQGYGLGCLGSELPHLYINELTLDPTTCPGGMACFQDSAPFVNIGIFNYWTGTRSLSSPNSVFTLSTSASLGRQIFGLDTSRYFVWPVRPAAAPALPEVTMRLYGHPRENSAARGAIVVRTGSTAAALTVNLTITDVDTISGVDYVAIPTTIVIPAGSDEATVFVTPIDDAIVEDLIEELNIEVAASADYTIGAMNSVDVGIIDDDGVPVISIQTHDHAAEPATDGLFQVFRVGGDINLPLEVNIAVLGGTAQNGIDYTGLPASVIIPANRQSFDVVIDVIDDALIEGTEVVKLDIGAAAAGEYTIHAIGSAVLDIVDDDAPAFVSVTTSDAVASEAGPDNGQFTVSRTGATVADLIVNISTSGAASSGTDYVAIPATVTIPTGAAEVTVDIIPIDDADIEGDESVIIHIGTALAGEYASGGANGSAQVIISDNDALAFVSVLVSDAVASEAGPDNGQFTVSRTGATVADLIVNISTSGAASSGTDYVAIPATVTIPTGAAEVTVDIIPIDDADIEGDESVIIHIGTALAGEYASGGANGSAQLIISDDDAIVSASPHNPIPTLTAWALILVSLLLALIAVPMVQMRKQE